MVDPRPTDTNGERKITVTPQLVHDIFEEHPVVAKAYSENVPNEVGTLLLGILIRSDSSGLVSSRKGNFGNVISSQGCLIVIARLSAQVRPKILSAKTPYSINIWRRKMTVRRDAYLSSSQFTHATEGIEPRQRQNVRVDPLMDLEATQEDHPEVRTIDQFTLAH